MSIRPATGGNEMKAKIHVTLKQGVLDPQGKAVENALSALGFGGVSGVRQGKYIELELGETDPEKAQSQVEEMCRKLLANTVIEDYAIDIAEG
jgi:phosphoribosylformylglycinamidine synthase